MTETELKLVSKLVILFPLSWQEAVGLWKELGPEKIDKIIEDRLDGHRTQTTLS